MEGETTRERLVSDLKTLVGDAEELLKATTNQAGEKVTAARQKIEQSLIEGKKALADAEKVCRRRRRLYSRESLERGRCRRRCRPDLGLADSAQLIGPMPEKEGSTGTERCAILRL